MNQASLLKGFLISSASPILSVGEDANVFRYGIWEGKYTKDSSIYRNMEKRSNEFDLKQGNESKNGSLMILFLVLRLVGAALLFDSNVLRRS